MMATEVVFYQFDDVTFDLRAGRVLRAGSPVALEPKGYDLLVLLASRSGELVTRQEVLDRVWAGVYVTDNAVARVVAQVRRALGDTARGARYIETVPTRGYRFIAPVTRIAGPAQADAPVSQPEGSAGGAAGETASAGPVPVADATSSAPGGSTAHPLWAAGLTALALVALVLAWRSQDTDPSRSSATPPGVRTQVTSSAALDAFPAWAPEAAAAKVEG